MLLLLIHSIDGNQFIEVKGRVLTYLKWGARVRCVPIRDNLTEPYRASRMAAVDESGQSTSIKSDTACKIRCQLLQQCVLPTEENPL